MTINELNYEPAVANLNAATCAMNEAILEAEDAIRAMRSGVFVEVELTKEPARKLCWQRHDEKWGLFVVEANGQFVPVLSASRLARASVADALEPLLAAILVECERQSAFVVASVGKCKAFAERMRAAQR